MKQLYRSLGISDAVQNFAEEIREGLEERVC